MGIQDRKVRERDSFRKLIVATAHELLLTQGLKGLTMRALANTIEYSQSKIYEFFKNKDQLCEVIFEELCEKMLNEMMTVPKDLPPGQYFTELNMKVIEFHYNFPHSEELFNLVSYGPERFKTPTIFLEVERVSKEAIKNLNSPFIQTEEELLNAIDIVRCFKIGAATLMASETSAKGKKWAHAMAENTFKVLLRGWK